MSTAQCPHGTLTISAKLLMWYSYCTHHPTSHSHNHFAASRDDGIIHWAGRGRRKTAGTPEFVSMLHLPSTYLIVHNNTYSTKHHDFPSPLLQTLPDHLGIWLGDDASRL